MLVHKIANVLKALPKSAQPGAKAALAEIWNAEAKEHAEAATKAFAADYDLVALVRAGARFERGALVERPDESGGDQQVA